MEFICEIQSEVILNISPLVMNSNNLYTLNDKKQLSQSKIFAQNNQLRLPSTHMQSRNSNDMYNSNVFMKTSALMNQQSQPAFFQPRQPLSPHYPKPQVNNSIQYIPQYSNNIIPMRQPQSNYLPVPLTKDISMERILGELRQKVDSLEKRLQVMDRRGLNDGISKKGGYVVGKDGQSLVNVAQIQDNVINSDRLKQLMTSTFQQRFQVYTTPIWQKIKQLVQSTSFPSQKLLRLQQSFLRLQSQKLHEEQLANRIKTIEKTIREMGEDIHLVNDKEESLGAKIDSELPWLRNELKAMKVWEKKWAQIEGRNVEIKDTLEHLLKKVKTIQSSLAEPAIMSKLKQLQDKMQTITLQPQVDRSFDKYPSQPIILKYIQRFQVIQNSSLKRSPYQQFQIGLMTYYIDEEGYLLDADSFYLVTTPKGERVRLSAAHLQLLKTNNILI